MEKDRYAPLSTSTLPNPLRPYHQAPKIGHPPPTSPSHTPHSIPHSARPHPPASSLSRTARELFPELDLDFKASAGEAWQNTRRLFDALVYRYMSVILAQPFDVAKVVLQVSLPPSGLTDSARIRKRKTEPSRTSSYAHKSDAQRQHPRQYQEGFVGDDDDDDDEENIVIGEEDESEITEDDDIPDYFTSAAPSSLERSPRKRRRTPPTTQLSPSPTPTPRNRREQDEHDYKLNLRRADSLTHAISQLYNTSGAVGLWRASNTTFLYAILLRSTDSFIRSLLLAILGLPEIIGPADGGLAPALGVQGGLGLSGLDLTDSPNPLGSLIVVGLSSCLTGLLLAPLDLVRTRLIVTPLSHAPRGLIQNLKRLPSLLPSPETLVPTVLSHSIPQLFSAATPLVLRRQFRVSPELTPGIWSLASFTTSLVDLFIRLPLETLTRRAQVSTLKRQEPHLPFIVQPAEFKGITGTIYSAMYVEGETQIKDPKTGIVRARKGQGWAGLVRGWRVGFWGLVGVWGAGALGPGEGGSGRGQF